MSCVFGHHYESRKKEQVIYYLSKKFFNYECRYPSLEKICCALFWAEQRLQHYMLYHTTMLISRMDRLKYFFEKPALSGRLDRWHLSLDEFLIRYMTERSMKGQAIANHLPDNPVEVY